ncbi:hypothetical protein AVEN_14800-1 [Araneus ventricosus]|uniref:Uncharacterized protein n=1 Tax=Araneus ventricosus TaxID=182803 RepID=A0A4Y2FIN7_ARAVE|nr:hypothetical protein AVEN_14800-1 [Araneus ventricosus]
MSACELLNGPSLIWAFGTDVPLLYRCCLHGTQLYASPGPANAAIELLLTGNKLPGLTSLLSNCIGWMDMYWYGDNLMNPWTQHVNRELFNLCVVQKRSPPPGTPMDLRTALQDSWCEKPPGYLQTLVDTMPHRVASLLCARVGLKRY